MIYVNAACLYRWPLFGFHRHSFQEPHRVSE
jgi:hypothetical protein